MRRMWTSSFAFWCCLPFYGGPVVQCPVERGFASRFFSPFWWMKESVFLYERCRRKKERNQAKSRNVPGTTLYYSVVVSRTGTGISSASTPQRRSHHNIERDDSRQPSFWMWGDDGWHAWCRFPPIEELQQTDLRSKLTKWTHSIHFWIPNSYRTSTRTPYIRSKQSGDDRRCITKLCDTVLVHCTTGYVLVLVADYQHPTRSIGWILVEDSRKSKLEIAVNLMLRKRQKYFTGSGVFGKDVG